MSSTTNAPRPRWGLLRRTLVVLALLLGAAVPSTIAQTPGYETLDLVLSSEVWNVICDEFALTEAQQNLAAPRMEAYWKATKELDAATNERFLDAGWREVIERHEALEAFMTNHRSPRHDREEVAREIEKRTRENAEFESAAHFDMYSVRLEGLRASDRLLETLKFELQEAVGLEDAQLVRMDRILRREIYHRNQVRHGRRQQEPQSLTIHHELSSLVDLHELIEAASDEKGEITRLRRALAAKAAQPSEVEEPSSLPTLEDVLEIYELRVDDMLMRRYLSRRKPPEKNPKLVFELGDPDRLVQRRELAKNWSERYDTFAFGAEMIRQLLAEHVSDGAARAWQHRVHSCLCPQLMSGYFVSRLDDWINTRSELAGQQVEILKLAQAQYEVDRQPIVERAIRAGVNARKRHYDLFGPEPAQVQFAKACLDYRRLAARTIMSLRPALTVEQFTDLRMCAYNRRPSAIGPEIPTDMLDAINIEYEELVHPLGAEDAEWIKRDLAQRMKQMQEEQARKAKGQLQE